MQKHADQTVVSLHFPPEVRLRLVEAAKVPVTDRDPLARRRRINAVMSWARANYPEYFRVAETAE